MSVRPDILYPSQIITSDAGWPYGRPQNDSVPGDGSGTPLEAAWVADLFGWEQALLAEAGLWPSGNPDRVGASQYMTALHGLFASKSVETRMPDDPLAVPVARTGLILPGDCYPGNVGEWRRGTDHWEVTAVNGSAILYACRTVPKGFTLTSVSVYYRGPAHTAYPPEYFPTVGVCRARMTSGSWEGLQSSTVAPASQAAYEARGIWTMTVDPAAVFSEDYDYLALLFAPEHGTNAVAGTRVYGATIYGTVNRARVL